MEKSTSSRSSHFVMVHGACHGAWCWYKVAALLKSAGHRVTALDLAASGINPKRAGEVRSNMDYNKPLMDFMAELPKGERVILVGHSLGGVSLTLAMETFPERISVAVFATATMPGPNLPRSSIIKKLSETMDHMDNQFMFDDGPNNPPTSVLLGPNSMASLLYQQSTSEDLELAQLLVRPCPMLKDEVTITKEKYGSVHRVYIVCDKDLSTRENVQRWMIDNNPTDEVKLISGSDHMVMFSKPLELCSCLQDIADTYS